MPDSQIVFARPRIVREQVEESARLTGENLDDISADDLIRFLNIFDLVQQRDVVVGYDDAPILPWSVKRATGH